MRISAFVVFVFLGTAMAAKKVKVNSGSDNSNGMLHHPRILALEMLTLLVASSFAVPTQIPSFAGAAVAAAAAAVYL
jgi:hypothetical protein